MAVPVKLPEPFRYIKVNNWVSVMAGGHWYYTAGSGPWVWGDNGA